MTSGVSLSSINAPSTLHELTRAAAYKDSPATNKLLKELFGIEDAFTYGPLDQLRAEYDALQGAVDAYQPISSPQHTPVLHRAAFTGALEPIQKIKNPVLVNSKDLKGLTPLHYAIMGKQKEVVLNLIAKADLAYLTPNGNSYLHYAALSGDRELLDLFLTKLDKTKRNNENLSPAHLWALSSNDLEGLKQCASAEVPLLAKDQRELSPIGILLLKAASSYRDPITSNDLKLLAANLVTLSLAGLSLYLYPLWTPENSNKMSALHLLHEIGIVAKRAIANEMISDKSIVPKGSLSLEKTLQARVGDWMMGSRMLNPLSAAGTTAVVSHNAFTALKDSKSATWGRTLLSLPVHAINVGASFIDLALAVDSTLAFDPPETRDIKGCLNVSQRRIKTLKDPFKRMTDPSLTEHLHTTDKGSIKCENNYRMMLDPDKSIGEVCQKSFLNKLRLSVHPDKNPENPLATNATSNLNAAIELLCSKKA